MRISPPGKAVIVALPAAAWLTYAGPTVGRALVLAVGAALLTFAWILFAPRRPAVAAPAIVPAAEPRRPPRRIARRPTGRGARDVRCPASRAAARAGRSTRRSGVSPAGPTPRCPRRP